jgi:glutathione synthase/RimK-type ligase-like ATP-grasp enzyme
MTSENTPIDATNAHEKYYTPQQLAKSRPTTPQTIVRQFRGRRGDRVWF